MTHILIAEDEKQEGKIHQHPQEEHGDGTDGKESLPEFAF